MTRARLLCLALALTVLPVACGGSRQGPTDAAAQSRAAANQRLAGTWLLTAFTPEQSLEPMFQALLGAQIGRLTVRFDGSQMIVTGTGLTTTRRYTITQAYENNLALTTYDAEGVSYNVRGAFNGNVIEFESMSSPWRGRGTLQRAQ